MLLTFFSWDQIIDYSSNSTQAMFDNSVVYYHPKFNYKPVSTASLP